MKSVIPIIKTILWIGLILPLASAYTNPIRNPGGSDPALVYTGGYYYLLTTTWTDVEISRATSIEGLKTGEKKAVYSTTEASRCCNVWAPEVHYLGGKWYIYYTAGNGDNLDGQNLHVLAGGTTPWDDYTYAAQLTNEWAIDASVLRFNDWGNYLMFSCFHGVTYQSLCVQKLGDDFISLTGDITVISQPTEDFETHGTPVNEGPAALYMNGKTYIVYSASYCWTPYYCLAMLTWDGSTDPSKASAWSKSDGCLLSSANGHYGTGHNSFFQSPDGTETWTAYHATSNSAGACDNSRYTMVQPVGSNSDGTPSFGEAAPWTQVFAEPS
ncbi:glycosyl hydrolase [Aspergillus floccosus]